MWFQSNRRPQAVAAVRKAGRENPAKPSIEEMTYIKANHGTKETRDLPAHQGSY
jgi:hypothetical protein